MLKRSPIALAIFTSFYLPSYAFAEDVTELESVVVTAPASKQPLQVKLDPKAPQQPLPAHDGAALLKNIPGMSVIRKGGTDGDPLLRGMAGSRLGVLVDGHEVYGGCGMRMDPPTAYIYPESFDKVTLQKGATVKYGAGFSAGVVNFERENERLPGKTTSGHASVTVGSAGRADVALEGKTGNENFFIQGGGTHATADDYRDGAGNDVHAAYTRWNSNVNLGWTPDDDTLIKLGLGKSDGEAAYADRSMDGVKFARENAELKYVRKHVSPLVNQVEAEVYHSYVDHVMDNYSLRNKAASMYMVSNPDRTTDGARTAVTLNASSNTQLTVGADTKYDKHTLRTASGMSTALLDVNSKTRDEDLRFNQTGVFAEAKHALNERSRVVSGVRVDRHRATDSRKTVTVNGTAVANATQGQTMSKTLGSGFVRYESDALNHANGSKTTYFAGLGHTERYPDYWELNKLDASTNNSVFANAKPEKTNQLDVGMNWKKDKLSGSVSAFYNTVDNYQLIKVVKVSPTVSNAYNRNIKAQTRGLEADAAYQVTPRWKSTAAVSVVRGDNKTDDKPLAQQPAQELKLGVEYDNGKQFFGAQQRLVAKQDRIDVGAGNIVGQDVSSTPGFGTLSLHSGTRPKKGVLVSAGIDNVFDKTYAEHLSRSGAAVAGYGTGL